MVFWINRRILSLSLTVPSKSKRARLFIMSTDKKTLRDAGKADRKKLSQYDTLNKKYQKTVQKKTYNKD